MASSRPLGRMQRDCRHKPYCHPAEMAEAGRLVGGETPRWVPARRRSLGLRGDRQHFPGAGAKDGRPFSDRPHLRLKQSRPDCQSRLKTLLVKLAGDIDAAWDADLSSLKLAHPL